MRKHFFLLVILICPCFLDLQAQLNCANDETEISFDGKAPVPWAIDGKMTDWEMLLRQGTGNPERPYNPPRSASFNWNFDDDGFDEETPLPDQDLKFTSFIHDDYNVFFYFRRLANGFSPSTFYYFCDVNADGYMNTGEPVFHATFNANYITSLTLSRYIPDTAVLRQNENRGPDTVYVEGYGNPLGLSYTISNQGAARVTGYPMPGRLEEVFNSKIIPFNYQLRRNEIFAASLTEDGFGVELAIPWRYLRFWVVSEKKKQLLGWKDQLENWLGSYWTNSWFDNWRNRLNPLLNDKWKNTKPLKPWSIFFYKLSMKQGGQPYKPDDVVDNAGACCNGLGRSGNVSFVKSISTRVLKPDSAYQFKVSYTNLTNASEFFDVEAIVLKDIELNHEPPSKNEKTFVTVYVDQNCNGVVDIGEKSSNYHLVDSFYRPKDSFDYKSGTIMFRGANSVVAAPFSTVCFIVEVVLPPDNLIRSANITIGPVVSFIPSDFCGIIFYGGRVINQVGIVETNINAAVTIRTAKDHEVKEDTIGSEVLVYPNPSNGTINVYLPTKAGAVDIVLQDALGRTIQHRKGATSHKLQISNLKRGIYILQVQYPKSGKTETKKIVVQ